MPPSTATFALLVTSCSLKGPPYWKVQLRMSKYSGVVPSAEVVQFLPSPRICTLWRRLGATLVTYSVSLRIASTSVHKSVGCEPAPPRTPLVCAEPERITSRLVPILSNARCTSALAPSPIATIAITEPTPMMMPEHRQERAHLVEQAAPARPRGRC